MGFASCKAFGRSISASLPKPQTPSPREGAECGAAALTKQGCLQSVAHSRCTMQRHQRLTTRIGASPKARMLWLLAKSFARCKTSRASNAKHPIFDNNKVFFDRLSRRKTACLNNHRTSQFIIPKTDIFAKSLSVLSQAVSSELSLPVSPPPKSPCNASNIANFIS